MTTPFEQLSSEFWNTADQYIGTKELDAIPMTRGEYNMIRGWAMPADENPDDGGYIVRYQDGYVSWSPEYQFDSAYVPNGKLSFSHALHKMKDGARVARAGWNGNYMFIFWVDGSEFEVNRAPLNKCYPEGTKIKYHSHIDMKTADGQVVPWTCSQTDMAANDWCVVDV